MLHLVTHKQPVKVEKKKNPTVQDTVRVAINSKGLMNVLPTGKYSNARTPKCSPTYLKLL